MPCQLLLLLPENPTGWPDWNPIVPLHLQPCSTPSLPPLCSLADNWHWLPNLRWKNSRFQPVDRACQRLLTGKRIITVLKKKLMKCFTLFLLLLSLCSTTELCCSAQRWAPQGGGEGRDLSSSCNFRLRLFFYWHVRSHRCRLSASSRCTCVSHCHTLLSENIGKEIAACSCCQLRFDYECLAVCSSTGDNR